MRFFMGCALLLLALKSFAATTYSTQIYQIDVGNPGESPIIMLANGLVATVAKGDVELLEQLQMAEAESGWINITLNRKKNIVALESIETPEKAEQINSEEKGILYTPSVFPSYNQAKAVFKKMNRRYNDESQCYNRAHVWSWEMYQKHHIRSMKIFVFFTPKYIRQYNFEWWFHVSPMVNVSEETGVIERVMDFRYTNGPKTTREWTDTFLHNNAECRLVTKYTDYEFTRSNADAGSCMLLKVPMYYYQPLDLEALDKKAAVREFWQEWEVGNAYREAFDYRSNQ